MGRATQRGGRPRQQRAPAELTKRCNCARRCATWPNCDGGGLAVVRLTPAGELALELRGLATMRAALSRAGLEPIPIERALRLGVRRFRERGES